MPLLLGRLLTSSEAAAAALYFTRIVAFYACLAVERLTLLSRLQQDTELVETQITHFPASLRRHTGVI